MLPDDRANLEMLEFGQVDKIFKEQMVHERKAHRENNDIHSNPMIDPQSTLAWVYPLEEHSIHMPIHLRDRLGSRYSKYTPNQQQALDAHIQATQQVIQQQQQAQLEQMIAMQAAGKGASKQESPAPQQG